MRPKLYAALTVLTAAALPAYADEPRPKFYLEDGKVVRRVEAVEGDVKALRAEVVELSDAVARLRVAPVQATITPTATSLRAELRAAGVNPLVIADVLKLIADLRAKAPREVIVADVLAILLHLSGSTAEEPTVAPVPAAPEFGQCYVDPATGQTVCPAGGGAGGWFGYGVIGPGTRRGLFGWR